MSRSLVVAASTITAIVLFGTLYSVVKKTYLDTSDPYLTTLPHHLHTTDYFASKRNPLNVHFIKNLWAWTSVSFFLLYTTGPARRTFAPLAQYAIATSLWFTLALWCFGPPMLERLTASTGGECTLHLPSGAFIAVPVQYCHSRARLSPLTHPTLFPSPLLVPDTAWMGMPRLLKGHDVSGHVFLLTLAILFLAGQLRSSLRDFTTRAWTPLHTSSMGFTAVVIASAYFAMYTTSMYFHTPFEKFTGLGAHLSARPLPEILNHESRIQPSAWRALRPLSFLYMWTELRLPVGY